MESRASNRILQSVDLSANNYYKHEDFWRVIHAIAIGENFVAC